MLDILAIVPARGGSVGVLRKNLRVVYGKPLVLHKLDALRAAGLDPIVCSTDDPVIASVARAAGYRVHHRTETAGPAATIADTVTEVVRDLNWSGPVGVFQCTSPALSPQRLHTIVADFLVGGLRTAASVVPLHDVCWDDQGRHYGEWRNRQHDVPALWRETGGIRLVRDPSILPSMVDMDGHDLIELTEAEALDIDGHGQLAAARIRPRSVVFMAAAGRRVGTGHLHRCLTLADELAHHDVAIRIMVDDQTVDPSEWENLVLGAGHRLLDDHDEIGPSVVVLDVLDSDPAMVWALRQLGHLVVALEDGGPGARLAHRQVNELFAEGQYAGPDYAVLRPEFLTGRAHRRATTAPASRTSRVLMYFGGSQVGHNMAARVRRAFEREPGVPLDVVNYTGADGRELETLAEAMAAADVLVTGQGRAVYAAAHVGVPTISIPLNGREVDHLRLPSVLYLPRRELVHDDEITGAVRSLILHGNLAAEMSERGRAIVDGRGTQRVAQIIDDLAGELP